MSQNKVAKEVDGLPNDNDELSEMVTSYVYHYLDGLVNYRLKDVSSRVLARNNHLMINVRLSGNRQRPGLIDMIIDELVAADRSFEVDDYYRVRAGTIRAVRSYADWHKKNGDKVRLTLDSDIARLTVPLDSSEFHTPLINLEA